MEQFDIPGYKMEEMTIDAAKAQVTSIVYFIPFVILFGPLYYFLWSDGTLDIFKNLFPKEMNDKRNHDFGITYRNCTPRINSWDNMVPVCKGRI